MGTMSDVGTMHRAPTDDPDVGAQSIAPGCLAEWIVRDQEATSRRVATRRGVVFINFELQGGSDGRA